MRIVYESRILRWFPDGTVAITFGETVYCANAMASLETLLHESLHVLQFRHYGKIGFLVRYFWRHLRFGYERNPLEIEARKFAAYRLKHFSDLQNTEYLKRL